MNKRIVFAAVAVIMAALGVLFVMQPFGPAAQAAPEQAGEVRVFTEPQQGEVDPAKTPPPAASIPSDGDVGIMDSTYGWKKNSWGIPYYKPCGVVHNRTGRTLE